MPEPLYRWIPEFGTTYGDLATRTAELVGWELDPEQQEILDVIYAEEAPGRPVCREVCVVAPRQNLKTATLEIAALTDLFVLRVPLHTWTAHLFDTSRKAFEHMIGLIESAPSLRRQCRLPHHTANGNESIELRSGEKIQFKAREKNGGRGVTGDRITFDEALILSGSVIGALFPTMATRSGWQVRYGSSAGLLTSAHLRTLRRRGRGGGDPRLAYVEYGAPVTPCASADCPHIPPGQTGHVEGCALDRVDLLEQANTALHRRIELQTLLDFRQAMPPEEFRREFLSWWDDPVTDEESRAIPDPLWVSRRDPSSRTLDPVALGIEVSPDRDASISAVGWRADGRMHGELIVSGHGTGWVLDVLLRIIDQVDPMALVIDKAGPAGSLVPDIENAGLELLILTAAQRSAADGGLVDDLRDDRIRIVPAPALDTAARQAGWRVTPSGQMLDRRGGNITGLVALSEARFGLLTGPMPLPPAPDPVPLKRDRATDVPEFDLMTTGF